MKRILMATSAALVVAAAAFPITAAQAQRGNHGGAHSGGSHGGGASAGARSGGSSGSARSSGSMAMPRGSSGGPSAAIQGRSRGGMVAQGNPRARSGSQWQGGNNWSGRGHHGRHHFRRGSTFAFGFGSPYYYDYGYSGYADDCLQWQQVQTRYGWRWAQVNVCEYGY